MTCAVVSPPACARLQGLLRRSLDQKQRHADPENQVDGFLGEGLPEDALLWSKAGWMSQARHDAAWFQMSEQQPPSLVVALTTGPDRARDASLLPDLLRQLNLFISSEEPATWTKVDFPTSSECSVLVEEVIKKNILQNHRIEPLFLRSEDFKKGFLAEDSLVELKT